MKPLDSRLRQIIEYLARGHSKSEIASILRISNGRLSQLLERLRDELRLHFADDLCLA